MLKSTFGSIPSQASSLTTSHNDSRNYRKRIKRRKTEPNHGLTFSLTNQLKSTLMPSIGDVFWDVVQTSQNTNIISSSRTRFWILPSDYCRWCKFITLRVSIVSQRLSVDLQRPIKALKQSIKLKHTSFILSISADSISATRAWCRRSAWHSDVENTMLQYLLLIFIEFVPECQKMCLASFIQPLKTNNYSG